jgi:stearoyl-CoA desaturase (delta-9 desaturase)
LFHFTCSINSLAHIIGKKRFETGDESRNSLLLSLVTLGEGWHNNHHHYMNSARQGFYWWEIDVTYYGLKVMERLGLIWELRPVPVAVYAQAKNAVSPARPKRGGRP